MRTKNILWAAMSMTAALMMTSCSSDDVQDWPTPVTKTIPYTVTVSQGTRATVDDDFSTLRFAEGDKLSISGEGISGELDINSADVGKTTATFSGNLTYTGAGEQPADDLSLTATLVSDDQKNDYPKDAYCATVEDAVQKYSRLTGTGTYGTKSFALNQGTAFLNFTITLPYGVRTDGVITPSYGVAAGDQISAVVKNNGTVLCSAKVTTTETEDHKIVAKFVLPVAGSTTLTNATVTMGDKGTAVINNATVTGKVYNVNKKLGGFSINASGNKVFFAPGNLQATYNGSNWTWAFAEHEWDYVEHDWNTIGEGAGNTKVLDRSPFISGTGTVDLFGWVGASSTWDGVNKFGITSCGEDYLNKTDGYGNVAGEGMKAEWNSDNLDITNGGTYVWRTLTYDEWCYMLIMRKVTVNGEEKASYGHGRVNGKNGLILLPDGWDGSVHGGFTYGTTPYTTSYTDNTYTDISTPTWSQMESAGCVFLPAAGGRGGTSVSSTGSVGGYWSSTAGPSGASYACSVGFNTGNLYTFDELSRYGGHSVRLVRPSE